MFQLKILSVKLFTTFWLTARLFPSPHGVVSVRLMYNILVTILVISWLQCFSFLLTYFDSSNYTSLITQDPTGLLVSVITAQIAVQDVFRSFGKLKRINLSEKTLVVFFQLFDESSLQTPY